MRTGRTKSSLRAGIALGSVLIAGLAVLTPASYATPEPTIDEVKDRVARLYHEAEIASERYNDVRVELRSTRHELNGLEADVASQQRKVDTLRNTIGDMVAAQAQASPLGQTAQLFGSKDPDAFIDSLAAAQAYNVKQLGLLESFEEQRRELTVRTEQLQAQLDSISAAEEKLAEYKAEIDDKADAAQAMLDELEAERAEQIAAQAAEHETSRSSEVRITSNVPASERASIAIDFALAQVGDAYVYGATGPDAWDCSGLTMGAWGAAGVALSHSSGVQASSGTPVSLSSIAPGDLVFYYSPISHVALYIGNGQVVHAPNPSSTVEVVPIGSMPITSVRRVG